MRKFAMGALAAVVASIIANDAASAGQQIFFS
jgi:hypothetical protein